MQNKRLVLLFNTDGNGIAKGEVRYFDLSDAGLFDRPDIRSGTYFVRGESYNYYLVDGLQFGGPKDDLSEVWAQIDNERKAREAAEKKCKAEQTRKKKK